MNGRNDRFCGGCGVAIYSASTNHLAQATSYLAADTARTLQLPPRTSRKGATSDATRSEPLPAGTKEPTTIPIELLHDII